MTHCGAPCREHLREDDEEEEQEQKEGVVKEEEEKKENVLSQSSDCGGNPMSFFPADRSSSL